jgi:hypothetical protein
LERSLYHWKDLLSSATAINIYSSFYSKYLRQQQAPVFLPGHGGSSFGEWRKADGFLRRWPSASKRQVGTLLIGNLSSNKH